jgi:hypothetical protein
MRRLLVQAEGHKQGEEAAKTEKRHLKEDLGTTEHLYALPAQCLLHSVISRLAQASSLLLRKLIEEGKMVGGVRSLYYLFRGMLYQELQLLVVRANYQTCQ